MAQPARPTISPALSCDDVDKTYEYFTQVLGWSGTGRMPGPDGSTMHAEVLFPTKNGTATVMLGPRRAMGPVDPELAEIVDAIARGPLGVGVTLYFLHPDVDGYHAFIAQRGAIVVQAPKDQFWGDRTLMVRTPDNYVLTFGTPIKGFVWPAEMKASVTGATRSSAPGLLRAPPPSMVPSTPRKAKAPKARPAKARAAKAPARATRGKARKARR